MTVERLVNQLGYTLIKALVNDGIEGKHNANVGSIGDKTIEWLRTTAARLIEIDLINQLTDGEDSNLFISCFNPGLIGLNYYVNVSAKWTDYTWSRFDGVTRLQALEKAVEFKNRRVK